jgi:hypothetical protein
MTKQKKDKKSIVKEPKLSRQMLKLEKNLSINLFDSIKAIKHPAPKSLTGGIYSKNLGDSSLLIKNQ